MSPDTIGAGISMGRSNSTFDTVSITCRAAPGGPRQTGVSVWDYGAVNLSNFSITSCSDGMYLAECDVTVRDSVIEGSLEHGIINYLSPFSAESIDLGTLSDPGHNLIQSDQGVGLALSLFGNENMTVPVHGNTWRPNVQGANAAGAYDPQIVSGPVPKADGNNYALITQSGTGVPSIEF